MTSLISCTRRISRRYHGFCGNRRDQLSSNRPVNDTCRRADAFLFVSTGAIYAPHGTPRPFPSGDRPARHGTPWLAHYPIGKIATEGWSGRCGNAGLPTTIARLNIADGPYGHGGVPILFLEKMLSNEPIPVPHKEAKLVQSIHTDDIVRQVPLLWNIATTPATVRIGAGTKQVSHNENLSNISQK